MTCICDIAYYPVRARAAHRSEMVTQLLFGEPFEVLESRNEWHHIRCLHDGYEGWVDLLTFRETIEKSSLDPAVVLSHTAIATSNKRQLFLPMGALLPNWHNGRCSLENEVFDIQGDVLKPGKKFTKNEVLRHALQLLETPYLWGGRSIHGIDCSGLMQLFFRLTGTSLPRDASQQATAGTAVENLQSVQPGDIAFFTNEKGKISHVGILLDDQKILHASYKVRIDNLTEEGIYRESLQKITHPLHSIRRII